MYTFSEPTLKILRGVGWNEEYRHDITEDKRIVLEAGYTPFPPVLDFLEHFGGLEFAYPDPIAQGSWQNASFIIADTVTTVFRENVESDEKFNNLRLCLIGMCCSNDMWLTMDPDGYVYSSYTSETFLIGRSGEDAIEALCTCRPELDSEGRLR